MIVNPRPFATGSGTASPSPSIWGNFDWHRALWDFGYATFVKDDFTQYPALITASAEAAHGQYKAFASTGGYTADGSAVGGVVTLYSDGDNEGASIATGTYPFAITGLSTGKPFWFEARVKSSTITDAKHDIFVGLIDSSTLSATVPITATTDVLASENLIGFHRLASDGDTFDTVYADAAAETAVKADAVTIAADTWVRLGITWTPSASSKNLKFWADGVELADGVANSVIAACTTLDAAKLGLVFAVLNQTGSSPGTSSIDWWMAAQLR